MSDPQLISPPAPAEPRRPGRVVNEKASLEALVHGIFAITMTLLILDLRLPEAEPGHLWESLQNLGPEVLGYLFGFVYLMSVWLSLREFVRQLNGVTSSLSVVFLLVVGLVSLTPFTVSTMANAMGDSDDLGTAVRLMAAVAAVSFLLSGCMAKVALRQGLVPATPVLHHTLAAGPGDDHRPVTARLRVVVRQPVARDRGPVDRHRPGHHLHPGSSARGGTGRRHPT